MYLFQACVCTYICMYNYTQVQLHPGTDVARHFRVILELMRVRPLPTNKTQQQKSTQSPAKLMFWCSARRWNLEWVSELYFVLIANTRVNLQHIQLIYGDRWLQFSLPRETLRNVLILGSPLRTKSFAEKVADHHFGRLKQGQSVDCRGASNPFRAAQ